VQSGTNAEAKLGDALSVQPSASTVGAYMLSGLRQCGIGERSLEQ